MEHNKNLERENRLLKMEWQYRGGRILSVILLALFQFIVYFLEKNASPEMLATGVRTLKVSINWLLIGSVYVNYLYIKHIDTIKYYRQNHDPNFGE